MHARSRCQQETVNVQDRRGRGDVCSVGKPLPQGHVWRRTMLRDSIVRRSTKSIIKQEPSQCIQHLLNLQGSTVQMEYDDSAAQHMQVTSPLHQYKIIPPITVQTQLNIITFLCSKAGKNSESTLQTTRWVCMWEVRKKKTSCKTLRSQAGVIVSCSHIELAARLSGWALTAGYRHYWAHSCKVEDKHPPLGAGG